MSLNLFKNNLLMLGIPISQRYCRYYAPINVKPAGGRQGIGRGFDRHSWPVGRAFDRFSCPRGRII